MTTKNSPWPWGTLIPCTFFASSAICYAKPESAPALFFFLAGCAALVFPKLFADTQPTIAGALMDEQVLQICTRSIVEALITASQEPVVVKGLLGVVKNGTAEALADEQFATQLKEAVAMVLEDPNLYKASARGVLKAAIPTALRKEDKQNT